jgi:DNA-binding response OmpR family regulator
MDASRRVVREEADGRRGLNMRPRPLALVADDDAGVRELVALHLRCLSLDVVEAQDGEEAVRLALDYEPDLLVLDVRMPGASGFEVTREVRRLLPGRVRVLLMSGSVLSSELSEGIEAGANAYVRKPFTGDELRDQVESLLAPAPSAD